MIHLNYFENIPTAKGQQNKFDDFGDKNGQGAPFCTIKKNFFVHSIRNRNFPVCIKSTWLLKHHCFICQTAQTMGLIMML